MSVSLNRAVWRSFLKCNRDIFTRSRHKNDKELFLPPMKLIKSSIKIKYNTNILGFLTWFLIGVGITFLFYRPFEQPIQSDRAYLMYVAQVVFRGDSLYTATSYGYTPLGTLIVGFFMKLGKYFSLDSIESARVIGILLYGSICGSTFLLAKSMFKDEISPRISCILLTGFAFLPIFAGMNAEPKLWVLFFSTLGFLFFSEKRLFLAGLSFSAGAMCWQVSVISILPCLIMLPWKNEGLLIKFRDFSLGVATATIPVLLYLTFTNGWSDFWYQCVVQRFLSEGGSLGGSPFRWIALSVYPYFFTEPLHFVFGFLGFLILAIRLLFRNGSKLFKSLGTRNSWFLVIYSIVWALFNAIAFNEGIDLLPLIPAIIVFGTFFINHILILIKNRIAFFLLVLFFLLYNYSDACIYSLPYKFYEQEKLIKDLRDNYEKPFVVRFEEYYTILEEPMPSKFIRFDGFEDAMISRGINTCEKLKKSIITQDYNCIIEVNRSKRTKSDYTNIVLDIVHKLTGIRKRELISEGSDCANYLKESLTNESEIGNFKMKLQGVPFGEHFYVEDYYSIFNISLK